MITKNGKQQLTEAVRAKGFTKEQAAEAVEAMLDYVKSSVANGETVVIVGFGKFVPYQTERKVRKSFGKEMVSGGKKKVKFAQAVNFFPEG